MFQNIIKKIENELKKDTDRIIINEELKLSDIVQIIKYFKDNKYDVNWLIQASNKQYKIIINNKTIIFK